jgi:hypothetical protein
VWTTFSTSTKKVWNNFILKFPDVLTERLGLTHLFEYDIQLLENTPVLLAPYRLAPSKMKFLREHLQQLLRDGKLPQNLCDAIGDILRLAPS